MFLTKDGCLDDLALFIVKDTESKPRIVSKEVLSTTNNRVYNNASNPIND